MEINLLDLPEEIINIVVKYPGKKYGGIIRLVCKTFGKLIDPSSSFPPRVELRRYQSLRKFTSKIKRDSLKFDITKNIDMISSIFSEPVKIIENGGYIDLHSAIKYNSELSLAELRKRYRKSIPRLHIKRLAVRRSYMIHIYVTTIIKSCGISHQLNFRVEFFIDDSENQLMCVEISFYDKNDPPLGNT